MATRAEKLLNQPAFDYAEAFKRNFGFLSREEQEILRKSRVAIPGCGGAGSTITYAVARTGIGAFNLADLDVYEMSNFNRQMAATMNTLGRSKTEVCGEIIASINPEADVRLFNEGVSESTMDAFLDGADIVLDGLDFYCFKERFLLFRAARERGIWVLTAPPLGFGFTLLMFDPKGMTYEDYFGFSPDDSIEDLTVSLLHGISPERFLFDYLDLSGLSFGERRLPSVSPAPMMLAGVMATEMINILTGKFPPIPAPTVFQFDAMLHKFSRRKYPGGMGTPAQRRKKAELRDQLRKFRSGG